MVKRSNEKNYVHLDTTLRGHRCSSPLGMIGRGKQTINFGEDCTWGNLAHEFMHSLGKEKMNLKLTCINQGLYNIMIAMLLEL